MRHARSASGSAFREAPGASGSEDRPHQEYLQRVAEKPDPRRVAKALTGELKKFWRDRVGDYRIICELKDKELLILVIKIGHPPGNL
jgi:mRNA-degrading endonuclease RelE of RelBE toxin-antitoxin system